MTRPRLEVHPIGGIAEVRPGDDLAAMLLAGVLRSGLELTDGDVLAVTSKVVGKAEGRVVPLPGDPAARRRAHAAALEAETVRVVARRGEIVIAETRTGIVAANAGIDASNAGGDVLVLLPLDPDASARRLRESLRAATGADVAVVVTDTLGRPWRLGQTDVAIGLAGMGAIADYRGRPDADGRPLEVTEVAVADEIAAAADLVKGKVDRVPAALVRGAPRPVGEGGARALVRPSTEDLFRTGGTPADLALDPPPDLVALLLGSIGAFTDDPVDPAALRAAVHAAIAVSATAAFRVARLAPRAARAWIGAFREAGTEMQTKRGAAGSTTAPVLLVVCHTAPAPPRHGGEAPPESSGAWLSTGAAIATLRLTLHARGLSTAWVAVGPGTPGGDAVGTVPGVPPGWRTLGVVAAGHAAPHGAGERP